MFIEDHKLDAVIKLPSGVFKPYAGVSTAILIFTKTGVGGTDHVWFYDMQADGYSLDDKRSPLLPSEKLGVVLREPLNDDEHTKNNLPDVAVRWKRAQRKRELESTSHCPELLRPKGGHRGGRRLRPIPQSLQGSRACRAGSCFPRFHPARAARIRRRDFRWPWQARGNARMITRDAVGGAFPVRPLGEVVEFLDSKRRPVKEADRKPGPFPYYGANGQQGTIDAYIFDEPLVLLAEDGGFFDAPERGICYRISGKTWVNNHAHVLRPNKNR